MSRYVPDQSFGAIAMADYEEQERKRIEQEERSRWKKRLS